MLELVDNVDLKNECSDGNIRCRISLIKQLVIGESPILVKRYVLDFVKVRLIQETTSCTETSELATFPLATAN